MDDVWALSKHESSEVNCRRWASLQHPLHQYVAGWYGGAGGGPKLVGWSLQCPFHVLCPWRAELAAGGRVSGNDILSALLRCLCCHRAFLF